MRLNEKSMYLEHRVRRGPSKGYWQNFWLVQEGCTSGSSINMKSLSIDNKFSGKRIRLKLEIDD